MRTASPSPYPEALRAHGGVRLVIGPTPRGSAALTIAESGGFRVRFPRADGACEGVLINTGGGLAGGDLMRVEATMAAGASACLTSQAAEKVYRSEGPATAIEIALDLGPASRLDWLPQEQILFDGARLTRRLDASLAPDATLLLCESAVFGRLAMSEALRSGAFRDRWRIRRGGRLVFAEDVRLEGDIHAALSRRAVGNGARAVATVLYVAPDTEARLGEARSALDGAESECGAGAFDGTLIARLLSPDPALLRRDLARFLERFRGCPLPRSWQT